MAKSGSGGRSRRLSNGLVALSSAAVLGVYQRRLRPDAAGRRQVRALRRTPIPGAHGGHGSRFACDGTAADSRGATARARRAEAPAAVDTRLWSAVPPAAGAAAPSESGRSTAACWGSGCGSSFDSGA